jgi:MFS family permease
MSVLSNKNCRLFFSGQAISLVGSWMTQATVLWMVYQLTHSSYYLGLIGFIEQIPNFVLVPITGGLIEQGNRHQILLITQILAAIHAISLAVLAYNHILSLELLIILCLFKGSINAFDITARQMFISEIVSHPADIPEAIGINSLIISSSRFIGPALAGLTIARMGIEICYTIDAISYIVVIIALLSLKFPNRSPRREFISPLTRFKIGIDYISQRENLRSILLLLGFISFLGASYPTLAPVFALEVFSGGADIMSALLAFAGLGSLAGSLYLISSPNLQDRERLLLISTLGLGCALVIFARSSSLFLSLLMMFIVGGCLVIHVATSNTLLQILVPNHNRGIIMSLFTLAYIGVTPFGNLLVGKLASQIGASNTLTINGILCIFGCFAVKQSVRAKLDD